MSSDLVGEQRLAGVRGARFLPDVRLVLAAEVVERAEHRGRGGLPQAAERGGGDHVAQVLQDGEVLRLAPPASGARWLLVSKSRFWQQFG